MSNLPVETQKMRAVYAAVDALQIPLYLDSTSVEGDIQKIVKVGPIKMNFPLRIKSDVYDGSAVGLLIHMRGELWAYLYVDDVMCRMYMVFLRGENKDFGNFKVGSWKVFREKFSSQIRAAFKYDQKAWHSCDLAEIQ